MPGLFSHISHIFFLLKIQLPKSILICFLLTAITPAQIRAETGSGEANKNLRLGTAFRGGGYYALGLSMQSYLKESKIPIDVIETSGSVENIRKLGKGELDLAIVQNDIAFFGENGLYPFEEEISNLRGIITFYEEPIFIITNNSSIISVSQLVNTKCNVGVIGSGLYTDARIILNSVSIWELIHKENLNVSDALTKLESNELSATFTNAIPNDMLKLIAEKKLYIMPFAESMILSLQKTYPYFLKYQSNLLGLDITSIGVKSILVCRSDLDKNIVESITKVLFENYKTLDFPGDINNPVDKNQVITSMPLINWHPGSVEFYNNIKLIHSYNNNIYLWLLLLIPVLFVFIIALIQLLLFIQKKINVKLLQLNNKLLRYHKEIYREIARHKYIALGLSLIIIFLISVALIQYCEHMWAVKNNSISVFDERSFLKNILWMFVYVGGGFVGEGFPKHPFSQFLVTLIPLISISGFITIVSLMAKDSIKNYILESKGYRSKMVKDHIIICGWNENVPKLIKSLLHEDRSFKRPIVILADFKEEMPLKKYNFDKDLVSFVRGEATKREDLKTANIKDADIAVIVNEDNLQDNDARSILKTLTIENCCKEAEIYDYRKKIGKKDIYTILELSVSDNFRLAKETKVDEIVSLGDIRSNILVHAINNPGVSKVVEEIFTYGTYNEFYSIEIQKDLLNEMNYDELLHELRSSDNKILLIAINIEYNRTEDEIKRIKYDNKLERSVITNPDSNESRYKTRPGDLLIVLAVNEKAIINFKKDYKNKQRKK